MTVDKAQVARAAARRHARHVAERRRDAARYRLPRKIAAPGTKLDRNAIVHVVVNSGARASAPRSEPATDRPRTLPSVVGRRSTTTPLQRSSSRRLPFTVRYVQQSTNNGKVVAQDPPAGQVPQGDDRHPHALGLRRSARYGRTIARRCGEAASFVRIYRGEDRSIRRVSAPAGKSSEPSPRPDRRSHPARR